MRNLALVLGIGAIAALAAPTAFADDAATATSAAPDATTIVRYVDLKAGRYELEVDNTSSLGYIKSFRWQSPGQLQLTGVTHVEGGRCVITDNTIDCSGAQRGIAPPSCTCRVGGHMTVEFTATGNAPKFNGRYWTYFGLESDTQITSVNPVEYTIPSWVSGEGDLPLCDPGTQPSSTNVCQVQ